MPSTRGVAATEKESLAGFVVLANSTAVGDSRLTPSFLAHCPSVKDLRDELVRQQVLVASGEDLVLTIDYTFGSPSTAAAVVKGHSSNGRVDWKT